MTEHSLPPEIEELLTLLEEIQQEEEIEGEEERRWGTPLLETANYSPNYL